jgi:hypothetical protein
VFTRKKSQIGMLLPLFAGAVACTPPAQDSAMEKPIQSPEETSQRSGEPFSAGPDSATVGPIPEAVSAAEDPLPANADSPAEAQGRRTVTTALVRVGADGHLTVELRDGRTIVLRNVIMRAKDYCGAQAFGATAGKKFCGGYADVAAARPGGGPAS